MFPFTAYLHNKPLVEKLGYVPSVTALKMVAADQKEFVAASLVLKVMMYFGGLGGKATGPVAIPPDFRGMSRLLHGAVQLDPYNMDAYYFAQAFLTWDVKQYKLANDLLDYGMKYRTWDWYLPFFAGFNSAYFLKDFKHAAEYYKRAGELSGQDLHISLSSRYMQEAGQTDHAIAYLTVMLTSTRDKVAKRLFEVRLRAFQEVRLIEQARDRFKAERKRLPESVNELLRAGYLTKQPSDPYGGTFYLEPDGKVATTSRFAFATVKK
jgi:tetratricopeptide (TPR) repeat protein